MLYRILPILIFFISGLQTVRAQGPRLVSGQVVHARSKAPLPYVTLSLKKQLIGVITNEDGMFDLYLPEGVADDTLLIHSLGYRHVLLPVRQLGETLKISLEEASVLLEEVIIRPLSPESYIRLAMRKIRENYAGNPFQTEAYYREKVLENQTLISQNEGVFRTFHKSYTDTSGPQHQLLLFRKAEPAEIRFMNSQKKKKNKATADTASQQPVNLEDAFGGPSQILKNGNLSMKSENFLDSSQFRSYRYSFARSSTYDTEELMAIDFVSRGKVDHKKESGRIYIHLNSLAIVKVETKGDIIIPILLRPLLFVYGIGIRNPDYESTAEFQEVQGRWYPKHLHTRIHIELSKKHLFKKNEESALEIEQLFTVNALKTENVSEIPPQKRFKADQKMETQVYNDQHLSWEGLNIIKN